MNANKELRTKYDRNTKEEATNCSGGEKRTVQIRVYVKCDTGFEY